MSVSRRHFVWLGLVAGAGFGCRREAPARLPENPADLVIVGGRVVTLDRKDPEVEAAAVRGGQIVALGTRADIEQLVGPRTRTLDLAGGVAVPGLTDAHAHMIGLGLALETVDLRGAKSIEEVVKRLHEDASPQGWVFGRGWDQNLWQPVAAMPTHEALTEAFPDRPVWLRRVDGHAAWTNQRGLELGGIVGETPNPEGGEILRDADGGPTGVLVDNAMSLVPVPAPTQEELQRRLLAAQDHALARGLTGVHEMGISKTADAAFRALVAAGSWKMRIHGYADEDWFVAELANREPDPLEPSTRYTLRGVKVYVDGALGSRGAALLEPYADRPEHRGALMQAPEAFETLADKALAKGWQMASHAIGDEANRTIVTAYGLALQKNRVPNHRFRVEHAQIVHRDDVARFAELEVLASMQPTHATSDMAWVPDRLGAARVDRAYSWRRFIDAGVHLPLGSDFPVEEVDVTHGIHAAVTRQDAAGRPDGGWLPSQRLTLDEAISGFSSEAAYAAHREDHLGSLGVGYQADITCFAEDLWGLEPAELRSAAISATIIAGEIVSER